jgi:exonuclease-1
VRYLVAPYEADAQLAYLSMKGAVDVVISEDSDTIPYGCRRVRGVRVLYRSGGGFT